MSAPAASVIIPFGGSGAELLYLQVSAVLGSVAYARERGIESEVLIAVNDSRVVHSIRQSLWSRFSNPSVFVVDAGQVRGPSFARNSAASVAKGEYLLFCDADDIVLVEWAFELVTALHEVQIAGGVQDLAALNAGCGHSGVALHAPRHDWGWLQSSPGSNLGIRASTFVDVGGFDNSLVLGEDKDLCWRAQYSGARFATASKAIIQYRWRPTLRSHFLQTYAWGEGDAKLVKRHREFGLRPQHRKGISRVVRAFVYVSATPLLYSRRWHAVGAFGKALGRIVGSVRHRVWAL